MAVTPLPPGQALTSKFPVVGERLPAPEALDLATWRLRVDGLVTHPLELDWEGWLALPKSDREADLHCVTGWSRLGNRLSGTPLAELLERAAPLPAAAFVRFEAASPRRHDTSLPLSVAREDTWLVHAVDETPLTLEHGFPLRTITPSRYFYKSLKWVVRIELLAEDRLGYWERESAYHNVGDPWRGDQRFTSGSIDPQELDRLRRGTDLGPWRRPRKVVLGAALADWDPVDRNLAGVQLKNCDLRRSRLAGVDLRRANLSLSDLRDADLRGADLREADLEGARLSGADLSGADLSGAALSATRFAGTDGDGAHVDGARFTGATGLLESEEAYLRGLGIALG